MIAVLNRFVSKAMDKCLPFFKTLKQAFAWTNEYEAVFQELKRYLSNPPLLSPSKEGENLYLYLAVSDIAVSAALIREEDKKNSQYTTSVKPFKEQKPDIPKSKRLYLH